MDSSTQSGRSFNGEAGVRGSPTGSLRGRQGLDAGGIQLATFGAEKPVLYRRNSSMSSSMDVADNEGPERTRLRRRRSRADDERSNRGFRRKPSVDLIAPLAVDGSGEEMAWREGGVAQTKRCGDEIGGEQKREDTNR